MSKSNLIFLLFIIFIHFSCNKTDNNRLKPIDEIANWAYWLQEAQPDEIVKSGFDLFVMDYSYDGSDEERYLPEEIEKIKDAGIIPICYISIGEAEDYRFYWQDEWLDNPPQWLGTTNPQWQGNYAVKYWDEDWKQIVFEYIDKIIEQGFMGIYLDKVDEFEYWADSSNIDGQVWLEDSTAKWMRQFIHEIKNYIDNKVNGIFYIIPQNGERILEYEPDLVNIISAWAVEDVFYNELVPWSEEEWQYIYTERIVNLNKVLDAGHKVISVDYVDDGTGYSGENKIRIDDFYAKCKQYNFIPYAAFSDRALSRLNIINGLQPF